MTCRNILVTLIALTALVSGAGMQLIRLGIAGNRQWAHVTGIVFPVSLVLLLITLFSKYLKNKQN